MILTEKIKIGISANNISYYNENYNDLKIGDKIEIIPDELQIGSHKIILSKCDICGLEKNIPYRDYIKSLNNGGVFTCNGCKRDKTKKTNLEKYGNENYHNIEKSKQTNLERYGCENVFQNKDIKEKIKKNNFVKYGFEFTSQTEHNKSKSKETNLEKYGFKHHLQNKNILQKQHDTNLERYGVEHISQNNEIKNKISKKIKEFYINNANDFYDNLIRINGDILEIYCQKCLNNFKIPKYLYNGRKFTKIEICTICNPINPLDSHYENDVKNIIKNNYKGKIILNDRKIISSELDIYLPDLKLAFEFNGLYWHSEIYKDNFYHLNKTESCYKQGIHLIHIYEDDWLYKQDIVKSRILNLLGKSERIFARKCKIKELKSNEYKKFLEKNHLQGFVGSKIKIALFYQDEMVSLMTFGSYRKPMGQKSIDGSYEMLRFCNRLNTNVIGGASRLFKYFIKKYKPNKITSYADRSWSQGRLYEKLGFQLDNKTKPNYYYFKNKKRLYRFNFRKDKLIKEGFDPNKTEHEIMFERKIYRIYDSGSLKFTWTS